MSSDGPREGRLNRRQFGAITGQLLRETFRPGVDASTGVRYRPLRTLTLSMTVLGLFFAIGTLRFVDFPSALIGVFISVFALTALAVVPETHDVRQQRTEILYSKPVSRLTHLAAFATVQLGTTVLLVVCLTTPALLVTSFRFEPPWHVSVSAIGAAIVGCYATILLSVAIVMAAASRYGIARIRKLTQTLLALAMLGLCGVSLLSAGTGMVTAGAYLDLATIAELRLLPPVWFADAVTGGGSPWERLAALLFVALAGGAMWRLTQGPYAEAMAEAVLAGDQERVKSAFTVRALRRLRRTRIGARLLPGQTFAVVGVMLSVSEREEVSRMRNFIPRAFELVFFVSGLIGPLEGVLWIGLLASFGLTNLLQGMESLKQSKSASATWLFHVTPVEPIVLLRALHRGALTQHFALPWAMTTIALALTYGPIEATALAVLYLALGQLALASLSLARPGFPLGAEQRAGPGAIATTVVMAVGMLGGVGFVVVVMATQLLGTIAAIAVAAMALVLFGVAHAVSRLTEHRARSLTPAV